MPLSAMEEGPSVSRVLAGAGISDCSCVASAWPVAARPTALAVIAVASAAPAMLRHRKPIPLARAVFVVVSWVWLVFVDVFMALIVPAPMASQ
jgi:hypothetical protein